MREPPPDIDDADVLEAVRAHWQRDVEAVAHLPVGFGAWHWRAGSLLVTLDRLGVHHTAETLEAAYAGAAELAGRGLDLVVAPLLGVEGRLTVPLGDGYALSVTPWLEGGSGHDGHDGYADLATLDRLHAEPPPEGIPRWHPLVGPDLPEELAARVLEPWESGPRGEEARTALRDHLDDIARWTADYLRAAASSDPGGWVATHGEPHARNQLVTAAGLRLVDWESLRLAPRERDLRWLAPDDRATADPVLLAMFDLEWRLDEVAQYADWFQAPHRGTESDRVALGGLLHELRR